MSITLSPVTMTFFFFLAWTFFFFTSWERHQTTETVRCCFHSLQGAGRELQPGTSPASAGFGRRRFPSWRWRLFYFGKILLWLAGLQFKWQQEACSLFTRAVLWLVNGFAAPLYISLSTQSHKNQKTGLHHKFIWVIPGNTTGMAQEASFQLVSVSGLAPIPTTSAGCGVQCQP